MLYTTPESVFVKRQDIFVQFTSLRSSSSRSNHSEEHDYTDDRGQCDYAEWNEDAIHPGIALVERFLSSSLVFSLTVIGAVTEGEHKTGDQ